MNNKHGIGCKVKEINKYKKFTFRGYARISSKEVADILCNKFGSKVATQKDIYELKLKIEKVRADLAVQIEKYRNEL